MDSKRLFDSRSQRMGLVMVFPPGVTSLFNPNVHRLVREVEGLLEDTFVTFALSGGAEPDVEGAINAARFAGCSSAVVIHSEDWLGDDVWIDPAADTMQVDLHGAIGLRGSARQVVAAYNSAQAMSGIAA